MQHTPKEHAERLAKARARIELFQSNATVAKPRAELFTAQGKPRAELFTSRMKTVEEA